MQRICTLKQVYNKCPFVGEKQECKTDKPCSMAQKLENSKEKYVRQPRWYEQYYEKRKVNKNLKHIGNDIDFK